MDRIDWTGTTDEGRAAMEEFGFAPVPLEDFGAPTPGRIADRLSDIAADLENGDLGRIADGVAAVKRLVLALDAWDACILHQEIKGGR